LREQFESRFRWVVTSILDAAFLVLWVVLQWGVNRIKFFFPLVGMDEWIFLVFHILFAVSTLVPIMIFIIKDIWIMVINTRKAIEQKSQTTIEDSADFQAKANNTGTNTSIKPDSTLVKTHTRAKKDRSQNIELSEKNDEEQQSKSG